MHHQHAQFISVARYTECRMQVSVWRNTDCQSNSQHRTEWSTYDPPQMTNWLWHIILVYSNHHLHL